MPDIAAPVVANENGDVHVFASTERMSSYVELIDVENGEYEFFDGLGRQLIPDMRDGDLHFRVDVEEHDAPERLRRVLQNYFNRLPDRHSSFTVRARSENSLAELVALRWELKEASRRGRGRWWNMWSRS
jgi:hypothetical protein